MENWLPVVGFEGFYEVSDAGQIRSLTRTFMRKHGKTTHPVQYTYRGAIMTPWINRVGGVPMVTLNANGKKLSVAVHRLVMFAFVGPAPDGMDCCHYNGDTTDNRLENLRWDTPAANEADKLRHGRAQTGTRCHFNKLSAEQVQQIRARIKAGETLRSIASDYSVTPEAIGLIKAGKNWKWLPEIAA